MKALNSQSESEIFAITRHSTSEIIMSGARLGRNVPAIVHSIVDVKWYLL